MLAVFRRREPREAVATIQDERRGLRRGTYVGCVCVFMSVKWGGQNCGCSHVIICVLTAHPPAKHNHGNQLLAQRMGARLLQLPWPHRC